MINFFYMGGYAFYIWPAYGIVIGSLFLQWFLAWRRYKKCVRAKHE